MVLLIGNYSPDQQQSMQRVNAMMLQGLNAAGLEAELIKPEPVMGNFQWADRFIAKWLAYIDKYILFPFRLRKQLAKGPALVHVLDHSNAVYVAPCHRHAPVLVTCHDMLAVRGALGEQTDCPASITGRILQRWILRGLRRADALACISQATAKDAERLVASVNRKPNISVVYLGLNYPYRKLDAEVAQARLAKIAALDVDLPFILHVGSNLRRKNREAVLHIFSLFRQNWNGCLVFAGDPLTPKLLSLARELGISDRIAQFDNPDDETLETLYNCALALLYPSRFEGFGWPVIEAQACGCPVVCSNTGPLPEAAGDGGLFHDVDDEEGFAADLLRLTDPVERAKWSEKSLANAARFSTGKMIAQYIDIYRQLGAQL
jgi:glycosyltransferase involved in cell wall biosynthesis